MGMTYGAPYLRVISVTSPAAGAEWTLRPAGDVIWCVLSVRFRFVTDANVAGREVALMADDGTTSFWQTAVDGGQAASLTADHATVPGANNYGGANIFRPLAFPANGLWLAPGYRLRSATANIQAGDQFSQVAAQVQEFHTGPNANLVPLVPGVPLGGF